MINLALATLASPLETKRRKIRGGKPTPAKKYAQAESCEWETRENPHNWQFPRRGRFPGRGADSFDIAELLSAAYPSIRKDAPGLCFSFATKKRRSGVCVEREGEMRRGEERETRHDSMSRIFVRRQRGLLCGARELF